MGPEEAFKDTSWQQTDNSFVVSSTFTSRQLVYSLIFTVDMVENTFQLHILETNTVDTGKMVERASRNQIYGYFSASCSGCDSSWCATQDMIFDTTSSTVAGFQLEKDEIYLDQTQDKIHLSLQVDGVVVSRFYLDEDGEPQIDTRTSVQLPHFPLDFSDQPKLVERLKLLALFS